MELQEFVKRAIVDIATAAIEANKAIQPLGAAVNPTNVSYVAANPQDGAGFTSDQKIVRLIESDVAVTASEGTDDLLPAFSTGSI